MEKSLSPSLVGEYVVCQRRGHTPVVLWDTKDALLNMGFLTCKHCGTQYRTVNVPTLEEKNIPTAGEAVCPPC